LFGDGNFASIQVRSICQPGTVFYSQGLARPCDATENSKKPDFQRSAYFSLFQDKLKMLCQTPVPASNRFLRSAATLNAASASPGTHLALAPEEAMDSLFGVPRLRGLGMPGARTA
jgi:hypothetical protein